MDRVTTAERRLAEARAEITDLLVDVTWDYVADNMVDALIAAARAAERERLSNRDQSA